MVCAGRSRVPVPMDSHVHLMKRKPTVSICLPTLNAQPFLQERVDSIRDQEFEDYEVIAFDSHSDDGTWETLNAVANEDPRYRLYQGPRGLYASWNRALRLAEGEYVYIATADDTMDAACLRKAVDVLDAHKDVALCNFGLDFIDQDSRLIQPGWRGFLANKYYGSWNERLHRRDGQMEFYRHFYLGTLYHSVTGLLIRKSLFDCAGYFPEDVGPVGDFYWALQAVRHSDVIWLPSFLATWRVHDAQATEASTGKRYDVFESLSDHYSADLIEIPGGQAALKEWNRKRMQYMQGAGGLLSKACSRMKISPQWFLAQAAGALGMHSGLKEAWARDVRAILSRDDLRQL